MAFLSEKIDFLRRTFMEMDYNRDSLLRREELYKFLDDKVFFCDKHSFFTKYYRVDKHSIEMLQMNYLIEWIKIIIIW